MPAVQTPYWCFTLNNPGENRIPFDAKIVQYLCYQLEEGASKTPHYQGFIQFVDKKTTLKRAKLFLGDRCHLEAMKAKDPMDAIRYAKKDEGRLDGPWEEGQLLVPGSSKRKRARAEAEYEADPESFAFDDPNRASRIEAKRRREWFENDQRNQLDTMDRPWQVALRKELDEAPDDRTIHWVYGPLGGEGKTTFLKALVKSGWECLTASSLMDMKYQYTRHLVMDKHLVIDIPRRVHREHYSAVYQVIEEVKNGIVTSTKYEVVKMFAYHNVHVVVMSNHMPDYEYISRDRICLHDLSPQKVEVGCGDKPVS
ncbi:replication-associated protein [Northern red-backed vole stool-associated alphasatellite 129]|nr:replication-associated protein [Northern red-backed vole stool-associated alphasatellite 129]